MIYELWYSEKENSYSFFPKDGEHQKRLDLNKSLNPDMQLVWSYKTKSYFEAMQARNDYLGYGQYKPEPDWEDIIYD